jgi:outer membrane protein OmpA-like peptidoglycan-associated protein/tetratricopeptide (TPR) repeat protein
MRRAKKVFFQSPSFFSKQFILLYPLTMLTHMRKNWLYLFLASFIAIVPFDAGAQKRNVEKYRNKANDPISGSNYSDKLNYADLLFAQGSYFNAIDYYQQLKQIDERNPYITFQLAECYRATRDYVPAAHYYTEVKNMAKKVYPYSAYYAGLMLKQQCEYQLAIQSFNEFLEDNKKNAIKLAPNDNPAIENTPDRTVDPKTMKVIKKIVKKEIEGCEMAIKSVKDPQPVTIVNAGPNVNSAYTELSPYPLGDSSLLFGTIGRNDVIETTNRKGTATNTQYKEKFMISHKQSGFIDSFQWPMPFYDGAFNDRNYHTANGCWAPGGKAFYFSKCFVDENDSNKMKCDIYKSEFSVRGWGPAVKIPIGDEGTNTMPFVAKVGKKEILFFSSNRTLQSRGKYDIWYSIIDPRDGRYGRPQNCGKVVNTNQDELTPYYDSRTKTLYFASSGQVSMGGFDIYAAEGGPSRYKNLHNMGYPINTCADELYYILDPVGKPDGYLVSNRIGSYALKNPTCCNDIWRVQYEPRLVVMGKVVSRKTNELMSESVVKMVDQKGDLRTYNSEDGKFLFNMSRTHSYVITADKPGYTSSRASVSTMEIKRADPDDTVVVTIFLDTIKTSFAVNNIYYDYDKANLRPESVASLDSVLHFLTDNPSISVEIYSYTDSKGKDEYNLALSQRRAQAVLDYLEKNGIDRARMTARGFGNKNSVAPNAVNGKDNPEGRQANRRTEFRIITDVPTRRVLYNSALPGTMDQQEKNLQVEPQGEDEPGQAGKKAPATDDEE